MKTLEEMLPQELPLFKLPEYETFSATCIAHDSEKRIAFRITFTLYPQTQTIGAYVRLSRVSSHSDVVNRYMGQSPFYVEVIDSLRQAVLGHIADRFGGALHLTGDSVIVAGNITDITRLFGDVITEGSDNDH